ncbi:transposase [Xenorhabdus sp. Sc-CR9]|uniref:transposase n=1 Tax=Xenorhabdus sp. Sc-CR9 TaxID=2584468 RepID=UPI003FCD8899
MLDKKLTRSLFQEQCFGARRNMKAQTQTEWDSIMLLKRFIIEIINGQLKLIPQIEHSRHRIIEGFQLTVLGGSLAYCVKEKKPSPKIFYSDDDFPAAT